LLKKATENGGIAVINSPPVGIPVATTLPSKTNDNHNNNNNQDDSFRLAKQPQGMDESLGIVDLSMISRVEDHNMTRVTVGETPYKGTSNNTASAPPLSAPKANKLSGMIMKTPTNANHSSNRDHGNKMPSKVNSSFISEDSGSEASDDLRHSKQPHLKNLNDTSFLSRDGISTLDGMQEGKVVPFGSSAVKEKEGNNNHSDSKGGWKTAQSHHQPAPLATATPYANSAPVSNISLTNNSTVDSSITEVHPPRDHLSHKGVDESSDESSYGGSIVAHDHQVIHSKDGKREKESVKPSFREGMNIKVEEIHDLQEISELKASTSPSIVRRSVKTITVNSPSHSSTTNSPEKGFESNNISKNNSLSPQETNEKRFPTDYYHTSKMDQTRSGQKKNNRSLHRDDEDNDYREEEVENKKILESEEEEEDRERVNYENMKSLQSAKKNSRQLQQHDPPHRSLTYISSADSLTLNTLQSVSKKNFSLHELQQQQRQEPQSTKKKKSLSSTENAVQQWNENELLQKVNLLEAQCSHYEINLDQYREIIAQNETLYKNKLLSLEILNKNILHDNKLLQQEIVSLKDSLLNKNIELSSLESIKLSLEKNIEFQTKKAEKDSTMTILSQNKLIKNLENNFQFLKEQNGSTNKEMDSLMGKYNEVIEENYSLKERLIEKDLIIENLMKRDMRLNQQLKENDENQEGQQEFKDKDHFPSHPAPPSPPHYYQRQAKNNSYKHEDSNVADSLAENFSKKNERELIVARKANNNETKNYFARVSPLTYPKSDSFGSSSTINQIINRSSQPSTIPTSFYPSQPQPTYYQPSSAPTFAARQSVEEIEEIENIPRSNLPMNRNEFNCNGGEPQLSYSERLLLKLEQDRKPHLISSSAAATTTIKPPKYSPVEPQVPSSPPLPMKYQNSADNDVPAGKLLKEIQEVTKPSSDGLLLLPFDRRMSSSARMVPEDKKEDLVAMQNYLSEITKHGRSQPQMSYYNHLRDNLAEEDNKVRYHQRSPSRKEQELTSQLVPSQAFNNMEYRDMNYNSAPSNYGLSSSGLPSFTFTGGNPASSTFLSQHSTGGYNAHGKEGTYLPSVYLLNEDLKHLTQSFLPAKNY
jgi:hypothetical protein